MTTPASPIDPKILFIKRIWNRSPHNALTDLIRFQDQWFCTFRESDAHVYKQDGEIRLLISPDGESWTTAATFKEKGIDLRDPKLSITPSGKLMLLMGGSEYQKAKYITRQPRVSFSDDGIHWSPIQPILYPHEWLWRITWHNGIGYGASYSFVDPQEPKGEWNINLFKTENGLDYDQITQWDIKGNPNESTLRFAKDGTMIALVRREKKLDNHCWIGSSSPPYDTWNWNETSHHLGGPNFIITPLEEMWAAGRIVERNPYGYFEKTALVSMTLNDIAPRLYLPSGGVDCSYPGMVLLGDQLWMSYYSSHEDNTAIYLAKIQMPPQKTSEEV